MAKETLDGKEYLKTYFCMTLGRYLIAISTATYSIKEGNPVIISSNLEQMIKKQSETEPDRLDKREETWIQDDTFIRLENGLEDEPIYFLQSRSYGQERIIRLPYLATIEEFYIENQPMQEILENVFGKYTLKRVNEEVKKLREYISSVSSERQELKRDDLRIIASQIERIELNAGTRFVDYSKDFYI